MEAYHIYSGIMSQYVYPKIGFKIDCVVYMEMYNFMKEIPVYIFCREKSQYIIDLPMFIIDKSWRVCDSVMQLVNKPCASVV